MYEDYSLKSYDEHDATKICKCMESVMQNNSTTKVSGKQHVRSIYRTGISLKDAINILLVKVN